MTGPTNHEGDRPTTGVVEQLARDDVERKRFLTMAGKRMGGGAALGAFIAACGSSSSSSSSAAGTSTSSSGAAAATTSSGSSSSSPDLAIVNYALTLEYVVKPFIA
jgi:hypothetical protein